MSRYVVGVDLGGTNVRALLLDERGKVCALTKEKTEAALGPSGVVRQITSLVLGLIKEVGSDLSQVKGLGIGLPGVIASELGIALTLPNLPGWQDIPVGKLLQESLGLEVYCENDVRMAAWGEKLLGAGRAKEDLVCVTLGTGIGSGIFLQGKMWRGHLGSAGEVGHMTVDKAGPRCTCGNKGCLEMYASGRGIARRAQEAIIGRESSLIYQLAVGHKEEITAVTVQEAALRGDQLAADLVQETAEYLGLGLANVANILNPQLFILGGGVTDGWGEMLVTPMLEALQRRAMSLNSQVELKQAQLGEKAGVVGAAQLARLKFMTGQDINALYW